MPGLTLGLKPWDQQSYEGHLPNGMEDSCLSRRLHRGKQHDPFPTRCIPAVECCRSRNNLEVLVINGARDCLLP